MLKKIFQIAFSAGFLLLASPAQAQVGNVTGDLGTTCSALAVAPQSCRIGACTFTPTVYKVSIFEMGLCTENPFGAAQDGARFNRTNCVTTYEDETPADSRYCFRLRRNTDRANRYKHPTR